LRPPEWGPGSPPESLVGRTAREALEDRVACCGGAYGTDGNEHDAD
jgi:hypothetical protein